MLGAIAGDVIGSLFEWHNVKTTDFPLFDPASTFTDDTVLTVATAAGLLDGTDYAQVYREYYHRYPNSGYGERFSLWAKTPGAPPYGSFGNGSAMRVSPVAYAWNDRDQVLAAARDSAVVTHDHPEGVKGAQATALAVFLARTGSSKAAIRTAVESTFGYDLGTPLDELRPNYRFDVSSQGSVPHALRAFLEADGFEDAVRLAISIGGDSDTLACIAGAVAEAFYGGVPTDIRTQVVDRLDPALLDVVNRFRRQFPCPA